MGLRAQRQGAQAQRAANGEAGLPRRPRLTDPRLRGSDLVLGGADIRALPERFGRQAQCQIFGWLRHRRKPVQQVGKCARPVSTASAWLASTMPVPHAGTSTPVCSASIEVTSLACRRHSVICGVSCWLARLAFAITSRA